MVERYSKLPQNIQKMAAKYSEWLKDILNCHKMCQHCLFQGPPKYTQIGISGLKIYTLAALIQSGGNLINSLFCTQI
jgi:hypothetical protein